MVLRLGTPTACPATSPLPSKTMRVGTPRTPYLRATSLPKTSITLIRMTSARPCRSRSIPSTMGFASRHVLQVLL